MLESSFHAAASRRNHQPYQQQTSNQSAYVAAVYDHHSSKLQRTCRDVLKSAGSVKQVLPASDWFKCLADCYGIESEFVTNQHVEI